MVRTFRETDGSGVLGLIRELLPYRVETVETVLFDAATASTWVAEEHGEVVGFSRVRNGKLTLGVAPRARRRGFGTALWDAAGDGVRSMWSAEEAGAAFARRRGLEPTRRVIMSTLDLRDTLTEPPSPPQDVALMPWSELDDIPGDLESTEHVPMPAFLADASWAALVDGRPVSYALLAADERGLGECHYTFTLPDYRGRGLATLCKRALAVSARGIGLHTLVTGNDQANAAILAVNRRLGYVVGQVQVTFSRPGAETAAARAPGAPAP